MPAVVELDADSWEQQEMGPQGWEGLGWEPLQSPAT